MIFMQGAAFGGTPARAGFCTQSLPAPLWKRVKEPTLHALGLSASAVLYATSQAPYAFPWLAAVALVPWLIVVSRLRAGLGALSGLLFVAIWGTLSNGWIGDSLEVLGTTPGFAVLAAVLVVIAVGGLPWILIGGVVAATAGTSAGRRIAAVATAFVALGWVTASGPLGVPWETLGHSQARAVGVAQLAAIGGVPLICGLLAALNASVAVFLTSRGGEIRHAALRWTATTAGAYVAVAFLGLPAAEWARAPETPRDSIDLLVVQPNLPSGERWTRAVQRTNLAIVARQTADALTEAPRRPNLIVWPETVLTSPVEADQGLRKDLLDWVRRLGVPVILGGVRAADSRDPSRYRNSVLRVDPERGFVAAFDKTRAIPGIESTGRPREKLLRAALGLPPPRRSVEAGQTEYALGGSPPFAVAICFEALFPRLVAARRNSDSAAILVLANDSWFTSDAPVQQHLSFASFRAIEQRMWLVRTSLNGISAVVDPYGRRVSELPFGTKGTLRASVVVTPPPGPTEQLVLVLVLLTGGALGWIAAIAAKRRFR